MTDIIIKTTPEKISVRMELPADLRKFMDGRTFTVHNEKIKIHSMLDYVPEVRGGLWFLSANSSPLELTVSAEKYAFLIAVLKEAKRQWLAQDAPTKRARFVL